MGPARLLFAVGMLALLMPAGARAADIRVFCSNPMEGPVAGLGEAFGRATGHRVEFVFGVSTNLVKRLTGGESADAVLLTRSTFEAAIKAGILMNASRAEIGRVGIGVVVRAGAAGPDISTPDALKKALLDADSVVFNQRVSGAHFAGVLELLGIAAAVKEKSMRPEIDAEVFEQVAGGKGRDLGISTLTIIMADGGKTVRLVGPLPVELQNYEPYLAAVTANARSPDAAGAFITFLASAQARATLAKRGVEQAR